MQEEIVHSKSWFHRWESNNFPARLLSKGHYQTSTCECIKQFKFVHASDLSSTTDIKFRIIINDPIAINTYRDIFAVMWKPAVITLPAFSTYVISDE